MPSESIPYPILVFSAMLPWQFFASSLTESSNSLISNANMITKIYFPRIVIPTSAIIVNFVDFMISFILLLILMGIYNFEPSWRILTIPVFILIVFALSLGTGLWLATLNVKYRDFRYVVPFIVQFGLYISPVGFSSSVIPEKYRLIYSLNPMVGIIDGFRWAITGSSSQIYIPGILLSTIIVVLMVFIGIKYFRKMERAFADVI